MNSPEGMIPIEEFSKREGLDETEVINGIREGVYVGRKVGDCWFINFSVNADSISFNGAGAVKPIMKPDDGDSSNVVIIDMKMPFLSMVVFMVKWAIASIPAFIILFLLASILFGMGLVII